MSCLFSTRNYGRLQSFTRSSLFAITLFIFGHSGRIWGQLTPTGGFISDTINEFLVPKLPEIKKLR